MGYSAEIPMNKAKTMARDNIEDEISETLNENASISIATVAKNCIMKKIDEYVGICVAEAHLKVADRNSVLDELKEWANRYLCSKNYARDKHRLEPIHYDEREGIEWARKSLLDHIDAIR